MKGIVVSETYWAYKKYNKIISSILLVSYSSVITMMRGPTHTSKLSTFKMFKILESIFVSVIYLFIYLFSISIQFHIRNTSLSFLLKYFFEFAYYFAVRQYVCQLKKQYFFLETRGLQIVRNFIVLKKPLTQLTSFCKTNRPSCYKERSSRRQDSKLSMMEQIP